MGLFSSKVVVDMSSPKAEFVKSTINKDVVVIFSKSYCPYCKLAKEVSKIKHNRLKQFMKYICRYLTRYRKNIQQLN